MPRIKDAIVQVIQGTFMIGSLSIPLIQARQLRRMHTLQRLRASKDAQVRATIADVDVLLSNLQDRTAISIAALRSTLHSNTTLLQHAAERHLVALLLRRGYLAAATTHAPTDVLDALAILINLAVVSPETTLQAVAAVIELLAGGYGAGAAADAAWCLGNLAASGAEARVRLRQAGCVHALWNARATPNALWALGLLIVDRAAADQLAHEPGCGDALAALVVVDEDAAWVATHLLAHGWLLRGLVEALVVAGGPAAVRGLGYAAAAEQVGKRLRGLQATALQVLVAQPPGAEVAWALANWCGVCCSTGAVENVAPAMERSLSYCAHDDDDDEFVMWARSMVAWYCS